MSVAAIRMRGGSGLGDSLLLRPFAAALAERGPITVCSSYADAFIGTGAKVEPFRRERIDAVIHYVGGKRNPDTTLWEDMCAQARMDVRMTFEWTPRNPDLVSFVQRKAAGRPVILVHGGREPMGRRDRYGRELLPEERAFRIALETISDCFTVRIGRDDEIYPVPASLDLWRKTSVSDLLDLAQACDGVVAQCSFAIPLAEGFDKPLLVVWSSRGLRSANEFIRTITPRKMLSKPTSIFAWDDWDDRAIAASARRLVEARAAA